MFAYRMREYFLFSVGDEQMFFFSSIVAEDSFLFVLMMSQVQKKKKNCSCSLSFFFFGSRGA